MIAIDIVLCLFAAAALVPVSVFFLQVMAAVPTYRDRAVLEGRRPLLAVVMPAHDEASIIADTLRALLPQLVPGDRLLVVADNCSDDTAKIARNAGAEVLERFDTIHRGKGYALDAGVRHLASSPPEIVLIMDADCEAAPGAIDRVARLALQTGRPVQAMYLMHAPGSAGLKTRIAEFAWLVRNKVRALGYHRLQLPCQLTGTGMAFPWGVISSATLASGHIVEDLKLGIDLARSGTPPLLCPEALVTSYFPSSTEGITSQRTRWEHGHLGVILSDAPQLFIEALRRGDRNLLALALDLSVPPLALLILIATAICACTLLFMAAGGGALPAAMALTALLMLGGAVFVAWLIHGRSVISLGNLAYAPLYALCKIPLYLKFLVGRQIKWVRSKRDGD